jgi:hypothetical protein
VLLPRPARAPFVAVCTLAALGGCASEDREEGVRGTAAAAETAAPAGAVPAGVAAQYATVAEEIESEGGRTTAGDWDVAFIVEPAEPWFEMTGEGAPRRREPAPGETHHIEIVPFEAATGRIAPNVPIRLEVVDGAGEVVDADDLAFFSAEFFHYANNFSVPDEGDYTLRASLQPPPYARHGDTVEDLTLLEPLAVEFEGVHLGGGG